MTPMIDVVFLLIIFFLVSSHLAKQETRLPVDLPVANTALPNDLEIAPLTIHVDARSRLFIATREIELPSLRSVIREYKGASSEPSVRIRTDRTVPYHSIEPILREAAEAGVSDVRIAVLTEESR